MYYKERKGRLWKKKWLGWEYRFSFLCGMLTNQTVWPWWIANLFESNLTDPQKERLDYMILNILSGSKILT